ncbi:MAG: TauD/TfdA dioxygenase family protein, partial [Alphaproteobacteria bacterium]
MASATIEVTPISGALGAEVAGVDLAGPLGNEAFAAVHAALLEHLLLYFPDQRLSPEGLMAFGRRFGELIVHPFLPHLDDHAEVMLVDKKEESRINTGNGWHTDMSFLAEPPMGTALHARITPPFGGDTLFANMYAAYDALTGGMKRLLAGLTAVHDFRDDFRRAARNGRTSVDEAAIEAAHEAYPPAEHPVVRTHPESGRKALYVNRLFTSHFKGMTRAESRPLLDFLFEHSVRPEFVCRLRWQPRALALWDNRCTQHYAINDYHGRRRLMHRVTIKG